MLGDVVGEYVKKCELFQKHGKMQNLISPELQSIPVEHLSYGVMEVMKQIGVDICSLQEVNGYKHLVVYLDCFSKRSEAKPLKDKLAESVSIFLYEIIYRHVCMRIQINDQGREFVNDVITKLHEMTGVDQRVTSAYHPQANGVCKRQNRTIKDSLVKVLNARPSEWPYEGVLLAHRVSRHSSTKYAPFFLMYNRQPDLPIDIQYNLNTSNDAGEAEYPFKKETFDTMLSATLSPRQKTHQKTDENIIKATKKQQRDYNRRHTLPTSLKVKDKVWLKKLKKIGQKKWEILLQMVSPVCCRKHFQEMSVYIL